MAARQATRREPASAREAVPFDCFGGVVSAAGQKTA